MKMASEEFLLYWGYTGKQFFEMGIEAERAGEQEGDWILSGTRVMLEVRATFVT